MSEFIYLLNSFEAASQSNAPSENGYREKHCAVIDYVAAKESELTAATAALEGLGAKMIDGVWRMPCPQCVRACDPANGYGPSVCNEHCARSCHGTGWVSILHADSAKEKP